MNAALEKIVAVCGAFAFATFVATVKVPVERAVGGAGVQRREIPADVLCGGHAARLEAGKASRIWRPHLHRLAAGSKITPL